MKIIGRNAVIEAIKSGQTIDRLVAARDQKDAGAQRIINEAKSRGIKVFFYDKDVLDRESAGKKHQGFIAEVTDFKYCELEDILAYAEEKGQPPFVLILDGVEDPHNLGSIIRVAECAGVHGVIIPRHRSVSVNDTVVKVSAGAASHVKVAKVTNINDAIEELKSKNVWVYAADMDGGSIYDARLTGAIAFVIGGEGQGVKRLTKQKCDGVVALPMYGKVNSLNASVAAGIVVYEYLRQNL
ncbi:MAG: 23S rRNA (guanosine(2251)-2'-O)-methyltransferase RlmB [Clostridia bacterium]|nr:23S rRNA (guanosine(2251)-2'-O)-methyltransferase RlmB [Clostridia bacterium]MBQ7224674.1 23S rRNA (guanosine(2251)-2'-O)-methyltransferase RlmB [Clostridia bacterium]MBR6773472.1 23S rRNA (guanosine(2251)-2'-O)-methyltransferase RlmB [Clostridia bacterium]MBR7141755.1 23S rRNA (guanosine(2251)-2'-O)-methyltransferase RlmB [Clostridia bacterium]